MWIFPWIKLSWHFGSTWDKLGWLNWFWQFLCEGYLPLIRKDSTTHVHGLAIYVKEGLSFARDVSLEHSADSYLCFRLLLLYPVSYFFFLYRSPSSSLCTVFDSILSNIDDFLSINPSVNVFVFGDFNVHNKDCLTFSGGTLLRWLYYFTYDFTQMDNFPTRIPNCDFHSLAYLDLFISSDASICYTMASLPLGNSDHVVALVSIEFLRNSKQDVLFHRIAYEYSRADWNFAGGFKSKLMHIFLVVSIWSNLTHLHGLKRLALLP